MIRNLIFCVFILVLNLVMSFKSSALDRTFQTRPEGRLVIVLDSASVSVTGTASNELKIHITEPESSFPIEISESGGVIKLTQMITKSEGTRDSQKDARRSQAKVEISGGSLPLDVHVREGSVFVQKWGRDVYAHVNRGKILAKENSGLMSAHVVKGEILIHRQSGRVLVDSVQATSTIKEVSGDIDVQSFLGDVVLEKNNGILNLTSSSGNFKILSGQGIMNFETLKGNVNSQNFDGRVEGSTGEGNITVNAFRDSDVVIKSNQGKVLVATAPGSGAYLNLYSAEGDVVLPQYLKPNRVGSAKSFKGRLRGDQQKGNVIVKSQSGVVTVR